MPNLRRVGRTAEDLAADYLTGAGYTVVTRRYKARHGEIDLVALDGDTLVFVEVKSRSAPGYLPEASIGERKLKALWAAAREYLAAMGETERTCRFDLVALDRDGLRHHVDAFH